LSLAGANDVFLTYVGPVSESDFFNWEALICGPKDTPFVSPLGVNTLLVEPYPISLTGGWCIHGQTDIRTSRSMPDVPPTPSHVRCPVVTCSFPVPQPPDYPLSPFKMRFEPPLFHPNSKAQFNFLPPRPWSLRLNLLRLSPVLMSVSPPQFTRMATSASLSCTAQVMTR
jgi:ubiquitin-protein ligase